MIEIALQAGADLAQALTDVPPGTRVRLGPGEFRLTAPLVVAHDLAIVGAGAANSRVVASALGTALDFRGAGWLSLADLALVYEGPGCTALVLVRSGALDARGCRFSAGRQLFAGGDLVGGVAIRLCNGASGLLHGCELVGNDYAGASVEGDACARIERCRFVNNGIGLVYDGDEGGLARENTFIDQRHHAIAVFAGAHPVLEGNTFVRSPRAILRMGTGAVAELDNVTVADDEGPRETTGLPGRPPE